MKNLSSTINIAETHKGLHFLKSFFRRILKLISAQFINFIIQYEKCPIYYKYRRDTQRIAFF